MWDHAMNMNPNEETFENVTYDELQVGQSLSLIHISEPTRPY